MVSGKDDIVKVEILLHAQKLFQQFGLKKTTMDEIAASCGKAKSTLYHYYRSKDEVFDAVIDFEIVNLRKHVKAHVSEFKDMKGKITAYVLEFNKKLVDMANLYRIIMKDHVAEKKAKTHFLKMMDFEKAFIIRILEDGYDAGECQFIEKDKIVWMSEFFIASFYGLVQYSVEKDGFYDEEKLRYAAELITSRIFC